MILTLEDETGLLEIVVFARTLDKYAKTIIQSEVLTRGGRLQRQGVSGKSMSIVMEPCLFGSCGLNVLYSFRP
jgi:DNA polymerase III alpha subunit